MSSNFMHLRVKIRPLICQSGEIKVHEIFLKIFENTLNEIKFSNIRDKQGLEKVG